MENKKELFVLDSDYDNKHICNTSDREVPVEFLRRIESHGASLEDLNELKSAGFDIFKYKTQLTIHGIFPKLMVGSVGHYKNIVQNKNKSIGVKYSALDHDKRKQLYRMCIMSQPDSWRVCENSTTNVLYHQERLKGVEQVKEFRKIADRIDRSLFTGSVRTYTYNAYGINLICLEVNVMCFPIENMDKIAECITGLKKAEIDDAIKAAEDKIAAEKERRRNEMEIFRKESDERKKKRAEEKDAWIAENPNPFPLKENYTLKPGDIVCVVKDDGVSFRYAYRLIYKAGAHICVKECDENGKSNRSGHAIDPSMHVGNYHVKVDDVRESVQRYKDLAKIKVIRYTDKSILVTGDTYRLCKDLKKCGGSWNSKLKGFIFHISKEKKVRETFKEQIV